MYVILWSAGTIIKYNAPYIAISALALAAVLAMNRKELMQEFRARLAPHWPFWVYCVALFLAYTFYIFTVWYFKRYLFPLALAFILISSMMIDILNTRIGRGWARLFTNAAIVTMIVLSCLFHPTFRTLNFSKDTTTMGYMNFGVWARHRFEPGTVVGSCQTGALGYFGDNLTVVNLDGVVNKPCFEALRQKRAIDYMKGTRIDYFVDWEANRDFIERETRDFRADDLIFEEKIENFTSWRHEWFVYRVNRDR